MGQVDRLPTLAEDEYEALIAANRARYAVSLRDMPVQHEPERSEPIVAPPEPEKEAATTRTIKHSTASATPQAGHEASNRASECP